MAYKTPKGWIWITLIIAIAALVLAWLAFNRTGENLQIMIEQEIQQAAREIQNDIETEIDPSDEATTTEAEGTATTTEE